MLLSHVRRHGPPLTLVVLALMACAAMSCALAQPMVGPLRANNPQVAQQAFDRYVRQGRAGSGNPNPVELLIKAQANGLPGNSANVKRTIQLLNAKPPEDEHIQLVGLLGSLYDSAHPQAQQNPVVARELLQQFNSSKQAVARAALLAYSRCGYRPDVRATLEQGLHRGLISEDEMAQELAIGVLVEPPHLQAETIARLDQLNRPFGNEVLAVVLSDPATVARLPPPSRGTVLKLFLRNEPVWPMAIGSFGLMDAFRYVDWLHAVALLQQESGGPDYAATVIRRLRDTQIDPRKTLSYLRSDRARTLLSVPANAVALRGPAERAVAFAQQFPDHPTLASAAKDVTDAFLRTGVRLTPGEGN